MADDQQSPGRGHPKEFWGRPESKYSYRTREIAGDDNDPFVAAESYINRSRPDGSAASASSSSAARANDVPLTEQQQHHGSARTISNSSYYRGLIAAKLENLKIDEDDENDNDDDSFTTKTTAKGNNMMNQNNKNQQQYSTITTIPSHRTTVAAATATAAATTAPPFAMTFHNDDKHDDKKNDATITSSSANMTRGLPVMHSQRQRTTTSDTGSPQRTMTMMHTTTAGRPRNSTIPVASSSPYRLHRRRNAMSSMRRLSLQQQLLNDKTSAPAAALAVPASAGALAVPAAAAPAPARSPVPRSAPIAIAEPKSPGAKLRNAESMEARRCRHQPSPGTSSPASSNSGGEPMVAGGMSPWDSPSHR